MTLVKVDQAPKIFKIRQARPYIVHPETDQIYGHYVVRVRWADGTRKTFNSEEEANAFLEKRAVNQAAIEAEIPGGYHRAMEILRSYDVQEEEEDTTVKDDFDVFLMSIDEARKVAIIKKIREITGEGLKESKELALKTPSRIFECFNAEAARDAKRKLEEVGGVVELR